MTLCFRQFPLVPPSRPSHLRMHRYISPHTHTDSARVSLCVSHFWIALASAEHSVCLHIHRAWDYANRTQQSSGQATLNNRQRRFDLTDLPRTNRNAALILSFRRKQNLTAKWPTVVWPLLDCASDERKKKRKLAAELDWQWMWWSFSVISRDAFLHMRE